MAEKLIKRKEFKKMSKSKAELIKSNDFESAKERFENSNGRWKSHWFDCCQQIMSNCKEWAKKYIIDRYGFF